MPVGTLGTFMAEPMSSHNPLLLLARWTTEDLLPQDLPGVAIELIEDGHEGPALYRVASEMNVTSWFAIEPFVERMFSELGVSYPMSVEDARAILAHQLALKVVSGEIDPWTAALRLDRIVPHWETKDEQIFGIYAIQSEVYWDPGDGRVQEQLNPELMRAFRQLAGVDASD